MVTGQKGKSPILADQALDLAFQLLPGSVLYIHAFAGTETPEAAIPPPTRTGKRI